MSSRQRQRLGVTPACSSWLPGWQLAAPQQEYWQRLNNQQPELRSRPSQACRGKQAGGSLTPSAKKPAARGAPMTCATVMPAMTCGGRWGQVGAGGGRRDRQGQELRWAAHHAQLQAPTAANCYSACCQQLPSHNPPAAAHQGHWDGEAGRGVEQGDVELHAGQGARLQGHSRPAAVGLLVGAAGGLQRATWTSRWLLYWHKYIWHVEWQAHPHTRPRPPADLRRNHPLDCPPTSTAYLCNAQQHAQGEEGGAGVDGGKAARHNAPGGADDGQPEGPPEAHNDYVGRHLSGRRGQVGRVGRQADQ